MKLKVFFFGALAETLQTNSLEFEGVLHSPNLENLRQVLAGAHQGWDALISDQVLCAVNQTMCKLDHRIQDGDEIAFFPPVTGG